MYFFAKVVHNWLKGTLTRDCLLQVFFTKQIPPWPLSILLGLFRIFTKIRGDICNLVSLTPAISCSPVSTTPAIYYPRCHCYSINYPRCRRHRWLSLFPDFHRFNETGDKYLQKISLPTPESKHYVNNQYMSVNSNPTASQKNMKKLPFSTKFSFIADVFDTGN